MKLIVRKGGGELTNQFKELLSTYYFYKNKSKVKENQNFSYIKYLKVFYHFHRKYSEITIGRKLHRFCLSNKINRWKPNIIYSNTIMNGDVIKSLKLNSAPVIVHVRELDSYIRKLDSERLRYLITKPTMYFAVSRAVRDNLISNYGLSEKKILIVPPSIDYDLLAKYKSIEQYFKIRKHLHLPQGAFLVGAVGSAIDIKGIDIFLRTAEIILKDIKNSVDIFFIWIGDGPKLKWLINETKIKGIDNKFIFTGQQQDPYPYMNGIDMLFMCSKEDSFPRVNLEAAALGKPIIAFRESGGSCEFVDSSCGFIIDNYNLKKTSERILLLSNNTDLRVKLGMNACEKVRKNYTTTKVSKNVLEIFKSIAHNSLLCN